MCEIQMLYKSIIKTCVIIFELYKNILTDLYYNRYGQQKSCYVYRFVTDHCLEKKIYDRQINKQGMSDRIVDECNPDAHLTIKDVSNLCYDNEDVSDTKKDISQCAEKYNDVVIQKVIREHGSLLSKVYLINIFISINKNIMLKTVLIVKLCHSDMLCRNVYYELIEKRMLVF